MFFIIIYYIYVIYLDVKSDSELLTDASNDKGRPPSPDRARAMQKLKKMKLDER